MTYETLGSLYSRIGEYLLSCVPEPSSPIFLYAEAAPGVMGEGVYQDRADDILYVDCETGLADLLFAAWKAEKPEKRWSAMEFLIRDGNFSASFSFEKFNEYDGEREERAYRRHFGDKPLFYADSFLEEYEALDPKNFPSASETVFK